jgi:hypothetical protein
MPAGCWGNGGEHNATKYSTGPTRMLSREYSDEGDQDSRLIVISVPGLK